jgi:hypothetical protein
MNKSTVEKIEIALDKILDLMDKLYLELTELKSDFQEIKVGVKNMPCFTEDNESIQLDEINNPDDLLFRMEEKEIDSFMGIDDPELIKRICPSCLQISDRAWE